MGGKKRFIIDKNDNGKISFQPLKVFFFVVEDMGKLANPLLEAVTMCSYLVGLPPPPPLTGRLLLLVLLLPLAAGILVVRPEQLPAVRPHPGPLPQLPHLGPAAQRAPQRADLESSVSHINFGNYEIQSVKKSLFEPSS